MTMFAIDPYFVFGTLLTFLLILSVQRGLHYYYGNATAKEDKGDASLVLEQRHKSSGDGECRPVHGSCTDVIIVGAGVVGAALAHTLGKEGRSVHVIERDLTMPNRIVGEILLPGGYLKLVELGLEDCIEEIDAQRMLGYAIFKDGKATKASYPYEQLRPDVIGRSFHNGRFIQRMREKAATLPKCYYVVEILVLPASLCVPNISSLQLEQGTVTSLIEENGTIKGVHYKTKDGQQLRAHAPLTIVCDGCFPNLRRTLCKPKVEMVSCSVGFVLENFELPFANHGNVVLAEPSPVAFYPIGSTEVRCLVEIVHPSKIPPIATGEMGNYLKNVVAPKVPLTDETTLPFVFRDPFISATEKGYIRTMPNRYMPAIPQPTPGAFIIGDALNMRHSITAGGMTVALSDVVELRDLLKPLHDLSDAPKLSICLESFYTLSTPLASTMNTIGCCLTKAFTPSSDQARKELCQAILGYLSLGGFFNTGLMSLLSGLNLRPLSLLLHLIPVAIYGVVRLLLPFPSPKGIWLGVRYIFGLGRVFFSLTFAHMVTCYDLLIKAQIPSA